MKRAIFLATLVVVLMLVLAPVALAQMTPSPSPSPTPLPDSGGLPIGSSFALPAAALQVGTGILSYAILRRR